MAFCRHTCISSRKYIFCIKIYVNVFYLCYQFIIDNLGVVIGDIVFSVDSSLMVVILVIFGLFYLQYVINFSKTKLIINSITEFLSDPNHVNNNDVYYCLEFPFVLCIKPLFFFCFVCL